MSAHGPWIDVHAHPGRCFLAGAAADDPWVELLGRDHVADAVAAARDAGLAAVSLATVADLAVLTVDPRGGLRAGRDFEAGEAFERHRRQLEALVSTIAATGTPIAMSAADLERTHEAGTIAALVTCEGADFLEGRVERVAEAHALGMSSLTLVHYRVNELGDIQTEPPVHGGLTAFGAEVVRECNRLGVVIDCAHATRETTQRVVELSARPVMVSHSHLDHADRSHPRLLSDDHARMVAEAGGVIGAWPSGVTSRTLEDFVDEILRLVELVGIDHVAIGTDLDANYRPVVTAHDQLAHVASALGERGLDDDEVDLVMGGSVVALYRAVAG